jgi:hypothetical protein
LARRFELFLVQVSLGQSHISTRVNQTGLAAEDIDRFRIPALGKRQKSQLELWFDILRRFLDQAH